MGKMGGTKHLKRKPAPDFWPIHRKGFRWIVKPGPGPHPVKDSLPLLVIIRDILGIAKTRNEAREILRRENVKVDGVIRRRDDYPVGLMDVIEIPAIKKTYRVLPELRRGLRLHIIGPEEKDYKLCKIVNKTTVAKGNIQLNLHDGRNHVVKILDPTKPAEDVYKTDDLLKVKLPSQEILAHLKFEPGILALVCSGRHVGRWGEVISIGQPSLYGATAILKGSGGEEFEAPLDYLFPIGKGEPWISLPTDVEEA
ncbi:MAG: 30S ribosomal protein S4e [Candidatus Bathyarchaeia archaeon]